MNTNSENNYFMQLYLYNTLSRQKEPFSSQNKNEVKLYSCGPTVYNYAHIGNLRTYIFVDILRRTLEFNDYNVKHVMNITDVGHLTSDEDTGEDKLEKGAKREKKSVYEIAQLYEKAFIEDMHKLNILQPNIWAKATEHIEEQINLIKILEHKNYTYIIDDGVYFDTSKIKNYGKLANLDIKHLKKGARVTFNLQKKNITDFALWKFSPTTSKREMEWDSPWGKGFPGWHIECSAMAMKYLGETLDIHCGGEDHIPIHHTNEIAQSETATGKTFSRFWMHGSFLNISGGKKMAKSGDNFFTLQLLIEKNFSPLSFRYLNFLTHYRKQLEFSWQALNSAQKALDKLYKKTSQLGKASKIGCKKYEAEFLYAINDDLNMPQALAVIWNMFKDKNFTNNEKKHSLLKFDKVLGLNLNLVKNSNLQIPDHVNKLLAEREQVRQDKNWSKSDDLRQEIEKQGYLVEDTPTGTKITPKQGIQ